MEALIITCAQLVQLAQAQPQDQQGRYLVPHSVVAEASVAQRVMARRCAAKHGIRYRIVRD